MRAAALVTVLFSCSVDVGLDEFERIGMPGQCELMVELLCEDQLTAYPGKGGMDACRKATDCSTKRLGVPVSRAHGCYMCLRSEWCWMPPIAEWYSIPETCIGVFVEKN